jgi:hypothetical protein
MHRVHCFTSASYSYLDRARVLGETVREYHPDWKFSFCLCDKEPPGFRLDLSKEPFDDLVRIEDLGVEKLDQWIYMHDVIELCTAAKGPMLCKLLDSGAQKVVYLDPDIALFGDLHEIEHLLDTYSIILTPHQTIPDDNPQAIIDNEIGSMKYGIFNLGFLAIANKPQGRFFAQWWKSRLLKFCYADLPNGLFTDQKWCDHIPSMFSDFYVLRDPGYNVASWNLSQRPITIEKDGSIRARGSLLRFFHFTKVTSVGAIMLERYANSNIAVFELMKWYGDRLKANAAPDVPDGWWAFDKYSHGAPITSLERINYRTRPELQVKFPNPFQTGPGEIASFMNAASGSVR